MKVGVLSDSHDRLEKIERALPILGKEKVDIILHAGDIISPFSAKLFTKIDTPTYFTFGNNDGEKILLKEIITSSKNCKLVWPKGVIEVEGYKIALLHGEDEDIIESLASSSRYDLVVYGHWHKTVNKRYNNTLLVNPGELCGYLSGRSTFAIVKMEEKRVDIIEI
ncbi:MAG: metallophosphoesterase [Nitrososphaeria archaeon]|nr:metallophosphoesterase [Nitrososphaeria archaeon]